MILSKIENVKPEQKPNSDSAVDSSQVAPAIGNTDVMRRFSSVIDAYVANKESKFQLQYVDYDENQWTVPVLLTSERAYRFKNDSSVKLVRILWRSVSFELSPNF